MPVLRAYLFETLRLTTDDQQALDAGSPLTRSLLAYLLLNREQPSDRRRLAFLFWPRGTESAARRNLRQYLHRMRQVFEGLALSKDIILTTGATIQINPNVDIWLDVDAFRTKTRPDATLDELEQGVAFYRGDLLADLYEDWCDARRQELRQRYLQSLDRLSIGMQENYRAEEAWGVVQKWIAVEPFDETAHRRLMGLYVALGKRNQALQHYQQLRENLAAELGTKPLPETQAFVEMIQTGAGQIAEAVRPLAVEPLSPVLPAPQLPLVGRQPELEQIHTAWEQAKNGSGRFILLTGDSGIGKTRLLHEYLQAPDARLTLQSLCHEVDAMVAYAPLRSILPSGLSL
ncbi:MAG: AAA family ATPase [Anaerolineales bacterium]|nr:AAA family ATPase [Anaerolineales bacterium]